MLLSKLHNTVKMQKAKLIWQTYLPYLLHSDCVMQFIKQYQQCSDIDMQQLLLFLFHAGC